MYLGGGKMCWHKYGKWSKPFDSETILPGLFFATHLTKAAQTTLMNARSKIVGEIL